MPDRRIKAVLFDLGETLLAFGKVISWGVGFKIERVVDILICP